MGATEDTANNGGEKKIFVKDKSKGGKEVVEGISSHATPEGIKVTSPQRRRSSREHVPI